MATGGATSLPAVDKSQRRTTVVIEERQVYKESKRGRRLVLDLKKREEHYDYSSDDEHRQKRPGHSKKIPNRSLTVKTTRAFVRDAGGNERVIRDDTKENDESGTSEYETDSPTEEVPCRQRAKRIGHTPRESEERLVERRLNNFTARLQRMTPCMRKELDNDMVDTLVMHRRSLKKVSPALAKAEQDTVSALYRKLRAQLKKWTPCDVKSFKNVVALTIADHRRDCRPDGSTSAHELDTLIRNAAVRIVDRDEQGRKQVDLDREPETKRQAEQREIDRLESLERGRIEREDEANRQRLEMRTLELAADAEREITAARHDKLPHHQHHHHHHHNHDPNRVDMSQRKQFFEAKAKDELRRLLPGLLAPVRHDRHGYRPARTVGHDYGAIKPASHFQVEAVRRPKKDS